MNHNILLNRPSATFEPHILKDPALPFIFHRDVVYRRAVFNIHRNLEVLFFIDGEGSVIYDNTSYPVSKGDVVVINSFAAHQVVTKDTLTQFCLIIDNSFCKYNSIDPDFLLFQYVIRDPQVENRILQIMDACAAADPFRYTAIKSSVLDLLLLLCRKYSTSRSEPTRTADPHVEYVRLAIEYLKANLSQKITADDVAAHVGLSKFHFLREFKRITGYTLIQYINTIRCEYAMDLLQSGRHCVKEVAFLCGFESSTYFARVFKKLTSKLPSEFLPSDPN